MSCYKPKRKTASGVEEVTLPIASIKGLQTELDDLGNKTIDRVDYAGVASPDAASTYFGSPANAYPGDDGISYNSYVEISAEVDGSEQAYSFPISTHTPIVAGENVTFEQNKEKTAVTINAAPAMPIIRVGSVTDIAGTMLISADNPLIFSVEIIDGKLQIGDEVQICTRQLFTYDEGRRRKMRLRSQWKVAITDQELNNRFVFVPVYATADKKGQRLFRTDSASLSSKTLSALYVRVRRPVVKDGTVVDGLFSNVVTVWKRYNCDTRKVYIK